MRHDLFAIGFNPARPGGRLVLGLAVLGLLGVNPAVAEEHEISVFKSPTCMCCAKWMEHMRSNGLATRATEPARMGPIKERFRVPPALQSCHTAVAEGYVIEGHVPAEAIKRLLKERPNVLGLTVPGMVAGSPGMESAQPQRYQVLAFDRDGKTTVYESR